MDVLGIVLSLFLLMFFAYRGFSVILFAPIFAILAAFSQGLSPLPTYTELFMGKAVVFIKAFFPIFMLGAVFGKVMEETGLAKSVAHAIIEKLGKERAILAVILAGMVLTYGGVSLFVCVFAVYPFASEMFKEADIPKRLLPATIAVGAFSVTMDALPGTPQIQNIIPTNFFGTNVYAAPILGTIGGILTVIAAVLWLEHRRKKAQATGEGYGINHTNEPAVSKDMHMMDWRLAALPLVTVLAVNFVMTTYYPWGPDMLVPFQDMKLPLVAGSVKNVASIWSLITAVIAGIIFAVLLGYKNFDRGGLIKALNAGTIGSLLAIMNTGSEVGYGNVIASLHGFKSISAALLGIHIGGTPLFSEAITVTTLAGVTGSASGGMSIALDLMGKNWLAMANQIGLSPEVLHRVAAMASGGMDTLPHNGAVITLLAVCGLTHKQSYGDIFVVTLLKTSMVFVIIIIHMITGLV